MGPARQRVRLLLRGSGAIVGLAVVWWFFLLTPLLTTFRHAANFFGGLALGTPLCPFVTETGSGNWNFCVAADVVIAGGRTGSSRLHSIEFDMARSGVIAYTFGLPVYWALLLARPLDRRSVPPLVVGTVLTTLLEIAAMLALVNADAHSAAAQFGSPAGPVIRWGTSVIQYLTQNVAPGLAPFVVALVLDSKLRALILGRLGAEKPAAQAEAASAPRAHYPGPRPRRRIRRV